MSQTRLNPAQMGAFQKIWTRVCQTFGFGDSVNAGFDLGQQLQSCVDGVVPAARCKISVNPSNNDYVTVDGKTFKFVSSLGAANTYAQVKIGGTLAVTMASLVNAINQVADTTVVQATSAFATAVYADSVDSTHLRVRKSGAVGQVPTAAADPANVALTASLTQAGDGWDVANLNLSGQAATSSQRSTFGQVTITTAMITAGSFHVELPFPFTKLKWDGYASNGVRRAVNEAVTGLGTSTITLTLAGGGSPNWQATDVFAFQAAE